MRELRANLSFKLEVKIVHNIALLMFESELWHDQTQVLAQAIAEVTCMFLFNIQSRALISVRSGGVEQSSRILIPDPHRYHGPEPDDILYFRS